MKPLPLLLLALVLASGRVWWMMRGPDQLNGGPSPTDSRPRTRSAEERLGDALRDTDRGRRSARFGTIWSGMTADEAADLAPQLLANEAGSPFQNDWLEFLRLWGALDPDAALQFANENAGALADDWRRAIARGWAGVDPQAAAQWWLTEATPDREGLGSTIVGIWAISDWQTAAAWVSDRVPPHEQPGLANAIAYHIAHNQPETGKALLEARRGRTAPPTALETSLFNHFARTMPLEWLSSFKESFPISPVLIERLTIEMRAPAQESQTPDPRAKEWFLWLVKQDNKPANFNVLEPFSSSSHLSHLGAQTQLFQHWLAEDTEAASGWLAAQEPSPVRDAFASTLINAIIVEDPHAASEWRATLPPEDPHAASEWLATLSPESRRSYYMNWTVLGNQHRNTPEIEALMKRDGFDPRRSPVEILKELESQKAP